MDLDDDVKMDDFGQVSTVSQTTVDGSVVETQKSITTQHDGQLQTSSITTEILETPPIDYDVLDSLNTNEDTSMNDFMAMDEPEMDTQSLSIPGFNLNTSTSGTSESSPQSQQHQANSTESRAGPIDGAAPKLKQVGTSATSSSSATDLGAQTPITSTTPSVVIYRAPDPKLPYSSRRTGLVYDPRMRFHTELGATDDDVHPEDPRRIYEIYQELRNEGLVDVGNDDDKNNQRLQKIDSRLATRNEVILVHDPKHWDWVAELETKSEAALKAQGKQMDSVYLHPMTHYCARLSAGGCIEAARAVVTGVVRNAIAVIRPPGHHAEHGEPGGFCFFNNVCVATRVVQHDFPDLCRRVLILDWDVHHGNGIQNIFEDDPNVLYISLHVHKDGKFYPNGPSGDHYHVGTGAGTGLNVNIPWPQHNMRDGDYLYAFQQVVMPIAQEFNPDLVVIAAGFDAAEGDQLGLCHVSPAGFAHMTHMLKSLANGRVLAALEGGYNLRSIAESAAAVTKCLMGEPPGQIIDLEPSEAGIATVKVVIETHSQYWKCLYPKETPEARVQRMHGERLHDMYRENQTWRWFQKFGMSPLCIHRSKISKSFENQVLASDDFTESKPLLIIFHDPPETMNLPDASSKILQPHNIVINDVAQEYVRQAIENGFSVVDVNVPAHLTDIEEESEGGDYRTKVTNEIATYIWENYVEVHEHSHIFLLGIGSAAFAMIHILNAHETTNEKVSLAASFVANHALQGVVRHTDDWFPQWYFSNSIVWVAENHGVWSPDRQRKLRKKYGRLEKSTSTSINDMLAEHQSDFFARLAAKISPPPATSASAAATGGDGNVIAADTPSPAANTETTPMNIDEIPGSPVPSALPYGFLPSVQHTIPNGKPLPQPEIHTPAVVAQSSASSAGLGLEMGSVSMDGLGIASNVPTKSPASSSATFHQQHETSGAGAGGMPPGFAALQQAIDSPSGHSPVGAAAGENYSYEGFNA